MILKDLEFLSSVVYTKTVMDTATWRQRLNKSFYNFCLHRPRPCTSFVRMSVIRSAPNKSTDMDPARRRQISHFTIFVYIVIEGCW
jgi:hypothetical protein